MNYDEKIRELTERVEKLEKAENKRVIKARIKRYTKLGIALVLIILAIIAYFYINNKYIKPFKEKMDYINEKVDNIQGLTNFKLEDIQDLFKKKD